MNYLDCLYFSLSPLTRVAVSLVILFFVALFAARKRQLTASGIAGAVAVGLVLTYIGGLSALLMMLFFFLSSAVISKVVPDRSGRIHKKGARRDLAQVLANSLPCIFGLAVYRFSIYETAGLVAFAAALAEAMSDTWAGDIGILSRKDPVSIITFTKVPKGLSGGVSLLGCMASLLASFLMALLFVGCYQAPLYSIAVVTVSGALGALVDSVLGGTVQVHYRRKDGSLTEHEYSDGQRNERARGIPFVDNDVVNFLSGLFAFSLALVLSLLI